MRRRIARKFYLRPTLQVAQDLLGKKLVRRHKGKRLAGKIKVEEKQIAKTARIGFDYAGKYWSKIPWRFYLKGNKFVSKT